MSFTNTPLGQQRRLDRNAFLNGTKKQQLKAAKPTTDNDQPESQQPSPPRRQASTHTIPVSYSYGAPELSLSRSSSTSPPKPSSSSGNRPPSPARSNTTASHPDPADESNPASEPANVRYARLKQRNQALGPTASTSSTAGLRDTSVNVANAFTQAAFSQLGAMPKPKSSASWTGGSRLAPPPASAFRRSQSVLVEEETTGDHTGDVDINGDPIVNRADRGKSPFFDALGSAGSFILNQAKRATSRQPEDSASTTGIQQSLSSVDRTSDYEDIEVAYQRAKAGITPPSPAGSKTTSATNKKKPRKSRDNALYKPAPSESEESDGVDSDEGKRRKKAKQIKGLALPVIGPSKTARLKKPRKQSSRPGASILGEGDLRSVSGLVQVDEEPSVLPPSRGRTRSRSRSHTPRAASIGGHTTDSFADEVGLDEALQTDDENAYTDPDVQQQSYEIAAAQQAARSHPHSHSSTRSNKGLGVGAILGTLVRRLVKTLDNFGHMNVARFVAVFLTIWFGLNLLRGGSSPPSAVPTKPSRGWSPWSSKTHQHVPLPTFDLPPGSLEELIERLTLLERAQRTTDTSITDMGSRFGHVENQIKGVDSRVGEVDSRIGSVETRALGAEGRIARVDERIGKVDDRVDQFDSRTDQIDSKIEKFGGRVAKVDALVEQIDARVGQVDARIGQVDSKLGRVDTWVEQADTRMDQLGTRVGHVEQAGTRVGKVEGKVGNVDAKAKELEARAREIDAKTKEIEGHSKRFEGRAKEIDAKAKEIESKTKEIESKTKELDLKAREHDIRSKDFESKLREIESRFKDAGGSAAWWPRTRPGSQQNEQLSIGSEAFEQVVQRAVLATTKDTVARADFALYTGGGRVIPQYTSDTFSVAPQGWRGMLGIGTVYGRSPAVALVPDINVGNCWPFAGSQGQIAVLLSRSVRVDSVTIDHASKEVAYDLKAAPKKFAVWGLVEGVDNLAKLAAYQRQTEENTVGTGTEDEDESPFKSAGIKLAEFEYDIYSSSHIQTFAVPEQIREAGIDVGVVVFKIRSSWGDPNFTCIYRVRVHGEVAGPNVSKA